MLMLISSFRYFLRHYARYAAAALMIFRLRRFAYDDISLYFSFVDC